jgi:hypothetical protein
MASSTRVELCHVFAVIALSATSCRENNGGPMIESISSGGREADAENFCPILNSQLRLLKDIPPVSRSLTLLLRQIFVQRLCICQPFPHWKQILCYPVSSQDGSYIHSSLEKRFMSCLRCIERDCTKSQ